MRLAGVQEVAELLGVSRQRVHQLVAAPGFPQPIADLAAGRIWDLSDVEAWRDQMRPFGAKKTSEKANVPPRDPERPQDDPWDANAVRYLLGTADGAAWKRGDLMQCLREQASQVLRQPARVTAAAALASAHGVERRPDAGGKTIHFFRTDEKAPRPYPASASERRQWLLGSVER